MKIVTFCFYIILFTLFSCNSKSQEDSIQFKVDKSLLADSYSADSINFSFSPPLGWISDSLKPVSKQTQMFQNEKLASYFLNITEIFYDSSSTSFCSVSLIQSEKGLDLNYFTSTYNTLLEKQFNPENLKQGKFSKSKVEITQFLIMTETTVFFKLFLQPTNNYIVQLDYAIDRSIYPNYIKKIESSIGSITTI